MNHFSCLILIGLISFFFKMGISQNQSLIEFELKDQFDQEYTRQDFLGQTCILVGSDREGSQYNARWSITIHDSLKVYGLQDSVKFLALANLDGVPRFLRGFVKGKFPKKKNQSILLDWKGTFAETYLFVPDKSNIILFDKEGNQLYRMEVQELDFSKLKVFLANFKRLF